MNTIDRNASNNTPAVRYRDDGKLFIQGRSITEGGKNFYQPLIEWAGKLQVKRLIVDINLEYVNSTSLKKLLHLLKVLDANDSIKELTVHWHYEEGDEDALEKGQVIAGLMLKAEFRFHKYADTTQAKPDF